MFNSEDEEEEQKNDYAVIQALIIYVNEQRESTQQLED